MGDELLVGKGGSRVLTRGQGSRQATTGFVFEDPAAL